MQECVTVDEGMPSLQQRFSQQDVVSPHALTKHSHQLIFAVNDTRERTIEIVLTQLQNHILKVIFMTNPSEHSKSIPLQKLKAIALHNVN
jgi:hypothetical protein